MVVRDRGLESRGDGFELWFGDAVEQCGLDSGTSVPDGCWWWSVSQ